MYKSNEKPGGHARLKAKPEPEEGQLALFTKSNFSHLFTHCTNQTQQTKRQEIK